MARHTPLKGGAPRLLGNHSGKEGKLYRLVYDALAQEHPLTTTLLRLEAGRVALAWLQLQIAAQVLNDGQRARRIGKGRRPNLQQLERLSRRHGLADSTFSQAFEKFQELAAKTAKRRGPKVLEEILARPAGPGRNERER